MADFTTVFPKYEEVLESGTPIVFGLTPVLDAICRAGFSPPTIFVPESSDWMGGVAIQICEKYGFNWKVDPDLQSTEWYVEWDGKRFGSVGC